MLALTHHYPTQLIDRWTLADGRRVTLRPVLPQDAELEQALVRGLSREGRYHRYFAPIRELSPQALDALMRVDYRRHLALVVETFVDGEPRVVAEGQSFADVGAVDGEFAVVVADDWRRFGLATRLIDTLDEHARDAGLERLVGDVIATNSAMITLLRKLGFALRSHPGDARLMQASRMLRRTAPPPPWPGVPTAAAPSAAAAAA